MHRSSRTAGLAIVLALIAIMAGAQPREEPPKALASEKFDLVTDPKKLPESVQKAWAEKLGQPKLEVAPAGAPFQVTDVIMDPALPGHRLIHGGVSSKYAVVHYESGGVGHSFHVIVLTREGDKATIVWSGSPPPGAYEDAKAFLDAIRSGDLFAPPSRKGVKVH